MGFIDGFAQTFNPASALTTGFSIADRKRKRELEEKRELRAERAEERNIEIHKLKVDELEDQRNMRKMQDRQRKVKTLSVQMQEALKRGDDQAVVGMAQKAHNLINDGRHVIASLDMSRMNDEEKTTFFANNPDLQNHQGDKYMFRALDDNEMQEQYIGFKSASDIADYVQRMADPEATFKQEATQRAQSEQFNATQPIQRTIDENGNVSFSRQQMLRDDQGMYRVQKIAITPEAAAKYGEDNTVDLLPAERKALLDVEKAGVDIEKTKLGMTKTKLGMAKTRAEIDVLKAKAAGQGKDTSKKRVALAQATNNLADSYMKGKGLGYNETTGRWENATTGLSLTQEQYDRERNRSISLARMVMDGGARDMQEAEKLYRSNVASTKARIAALEEEKAASAKGASVKQVAEDIKKKSQKTRVQEVVERRRKAQVRTKSPEDIERQRRRKEWGDIIQGLGAQ